MPDTVNYTSEVYCAACDRYFPTNEARAAHIDRSSRHPRCNICGRRFLNKNTLRNHYVLSRGHHYCVACDRSFETASGLRMHIEYAAVHRDDSDDGDDEDDDELEEGWEDDLGQREFPDEQEDDVDDDRSWENYDECDFEDEDELRDPEDRSDDEDDLIFAANSEISDGSSQHSSESDQDSSIIRIPHFVCPLCKATEPASICSTACGHLFCTSCIRRAYNETGVCPVKACRQAGKITQLRKIYLCGAQ